MCFSFYISHTSTSLSSLIFFFILKERWGCRYKNSNRIPTPSGFLVSWVNGNSSRRLEEGENQDQLVVRNWWEYFVLMKGIKNTPAAWDHWLITVARRQHNPGFPGGSVVENLPANAGDTGSSPGLGRSHMPRSSWAREPQLLSLCVWSLCPATGGAAIVRGPRTAMKSGPRSPQLQKALARTEDPTQPKIK